MNPIDWIVLSAFLGFIVIYGVWTTRGSKNIRQFLLAGKTAPWWTITLSIMATQASAITFLSTPGQAFVDGMRFVQFYIGLPIAMIILSVTAVPIFHKINAYTAYEYLERRFDLKNRALGSILFLIQRGLAAGFTILAPALILSVILGWDLNYTIIILGILVIIYTASGGTDAVNKTHLLQMTVIFIGMVAAFVMIFKLLPADISVMDAVRVAGKSGKLNAIDFTFDLGNKYTFWTGLIGGTFLALSYFGTDQSQVQRYLSGSSIKQSRTGLLMNGIIKIPMQFFILFIGAMVFVFYQFTAPPLYFNPVEEEQVRQSVYAQEYNDLETRFLDIHEKKQDNLRALLEAGRQQQPEQVKEQQQELNNKNLAIEELRNEAKDVLKKADPESDGNDTNFIFLSFVTNFLPVGLIGLVLAAILSASMSSTSAELNALASTTVVDIYKRMLKKEGSDQHYLSVSKLATVFWGFYAIAFALFANQLGTLIEAVNILGSLFYGTILGIFLIAFYIKKINGTATFIGALMAEFCVLAFFFFTEIPYLWFNFIGCALVIIFAMIFEFFSSGLQKSKS